MEAEASKQKGTFILTIGPTGSGKSVLITYLRETFPDLIFPTSCTTREKRPGHESSSYRFLTVDEFKAHIDAGDFLEWAEFSGNYYGTLKEEITTALAEGKVLLKELEVQGARQIQELLPADQLVTIYIDAGSWEELEKRVRARAPISDEELAARKKRYEEEVVFKDTATYVIPNPPGELEEAKRAIGEVVSSIINGTRA